MPDLTMSPDEWSRGPYFTGFGYCTDTPLHDALHDGGRLCGDAEQREVRDPSSPLDV